MKTECLLLAAVAVVGWAAAPPGKPDFTGSWELNLAKSKFGKMAKPVRMTLRVEPEGDRSKAEQTTWNERGEASTGGVWYVDGKDRESEEAGQTMEKTRWDGKVLVNEKRSLDRTFVETTRLSLAADGKSVIEEIRVKSANGENREVLVFERNGEAGR